VADRLFQEIKRAVNAPDQPAVAVYWLRVSSQVRSTARVLKSRRFVEIALADAGSPFFGGQNGEK
jgi:hypothetical protein